MTLKLLFSASLVVAIGTITGRLLGLLREMMLASRFGVHADADMAIILLLLPDFITAALILGPASATLIPAFASRTHEQGLGLLWQSLLVGTLAFAVIAVIIALPQDGLRMLMSPQLAALPQALPAFLLALCAIPMSAATSILTAYLQYRGRFVAPAFANAVFNVIIILTLWLLPTGLMVFSLGILVAGLIRLGAHVGAFLRAGDTFSWPKLSPWQLDARLLKTYVVTATSSIFSVLPFYAPYTVIAYFGSSVALFNYAFKLVLLPGMLIQSLVQMVVLPWLVKLRKDSDAASIIQSNSVMLHIGWIASWVMCLCLSLAGPSVAALCFGYGKMTAEDIAQVGHLFSLGVWAMPGMVLASMWQQILYAHERTGAALFASSMQALFIIPACAICYRYGGVSGVLIAYAILQYIPIAIYASEGVKRGLSVNRWPTHSYLQMTLAATGVFIPLAWGEYSMALPPFADIVAAAMIGLITLAAGLLPCQPVKIWMSEKWRAA